MIDHNHKCVFIHIPKCGGQSVESIFVSHNGLTWSTRAPLLLRPNDIPALGPPRLAHLKYLEYVKYAYISAELLKSYTVFTVVRNPYRRVSSFYRYLGYSDAVPFRNFVLDILPKVMQSEEGWFFAPQFDYLVDDKGEISIDEILKLEEIDVTGPKLLNKIGIHINQIPHVNDSKGKRSGFLLRRLRLLRSGHFYFGLKVRNEIEWDAEMCQKVYELYLDDFTHFGYRPDSV